MIKTILKRDNRTLEFDITKISNAIKKSFEAINETKANSVCMALAEVVENHLVTENKLQPTVEEIQDIVEKTLIEKGYAEAAKAYILYRSERSRYRDMNSKLMQIYQDVTFSDASDSDIKRENANIDGDTAMGTMLKYGSEGAKQFYQMFVIRPEHAEAHRNGDIHIHDMDFYTLTTTCCQIDLIKLFKNGFSTGHGVLREPQDIASYSALACIAIQSNQNDQHGGQSIVNFDYAMAKGVAKTYIKRYKTNFAYSLSLLLDHDDYENLATEMFTYLESKNLEPRLSDETSYKEAEKAYLQDKGISLDIISKLQDKVRDISYMQTDKNTYQAMEAFIHNLNTMHSRAGAQTPFSSINYGLDTCLEAKMAVKNLLLATESGLGQGETPIFPIQIFRVKKGVNYDKHDPNYDMFKLACRVSSKRLFPNFAFQDAPFNAQFYKEGQPETEIAYMGCRTRVISNVHDAEKSVSNGRGNLSFTSINLPRLALEANKDLDKFFNSLDKKIDLVVEQLQDRLKIQSQKKVYNYPFLMGQGVWIDSEKLNYDDTVEEVLKHGTLSVGFIGLAETLKALIGVHHGESLEAQELGLKIIGHMRNRMDKLAKETKMNYSLLATPAEGLSGRFVNIDRKKYGEIKGITDRDYYTNSFHIPVYYNINAYDKINLEAPYHPLTNAGHITYVELDADPSKNLEAFETIIRTMYDAGIGYGSINHPVDRDPLCGYNGIIGDVCPRCGRTETQHEFHRIRRITGYLVGTVNRFNNAKRSEEKDRVKHEI
ncbi:MAG: anaerobic ribonucleoside triphosphate reductase [Filifactoraceae bacterium]